MLCVHVPTCTCKAHTFIYYTIHCTMYIYQYLGYNLLRIFFLFVFYFFSLLSFRSSLCVSLFWWDDKIRVEKHKPLNSHLNCCHLLCSSSSNLTKLEEMTLFFIAITTFVVTHLYSNFNITLTQTIWNIVVSNVRNLRLFLHISFTHFLSLAQCFFFFCYPFPSHFLKLMVFHLLPVLRWLTHWLTVRQYTQYSLANEDKGKRIYKIL